MSYRTLAIATVGFLAASVSVAQEARKNLGTLTCTLAKADNGRIALKGPTQGISCVFNPTAVGTEEKYAATVHHAVGKEVLTEKLVLMFAVNGPADLKAKAGWLQQTYAAPPVQADPAIGQTNNEIVLQFETGDGSRGGISVSRIDLKLATTPA